MTKKYLKTKKGEEKIFKNKERGEKTPKKKKIAYKLPVAPVPHAH